MKLPYPSCYGYGLYSSAFVLMHIQLFSALYVLGKYIETRVIQMEGMSGVHIGMTVFIFIGLIFNLILQFILYLGIPKRDLVICRAWLFLGIPGIIFWNVGVYEIFSCVSDTCINFGAAGIVYECYLWYVILAFTMSLVPGRKETGVPVPGQVNVNAHCVVEIERNNGSNGDLEEMELFERRRIAQARARELDQEYERLVPMLREFTTNRNNLISEILDLSDNGQANNNSEVRALTFDPPPNYNDIGAPPPYPGTNA